MTIISKKKNWNPWENCQKYALRLFRNAYTWHVLEDLIFFGQWNNVHDRSQNGPRRVTNDYLVGSLSSITRVITNNIILWETLPHNTDWNCFKTPTLQEISRTQNLHKVEHCTIFFGSHTFVPISWMCEKQTSVSHCSTESEIKSLDAGLRLDGIPALDFGDLIVAVLHGNTYQSHQEQRDPCTNLVRAAPHKLTMRKKSHGMTYDLDNVGFISSNEHSSRQEALLYIFEDNEAVIKMITKGRSRTIRLVSRTHRVALDWLFDKKINLDPKIQIKFVDTINQLADILTVGNFTRDEWNHLLCLFNISHFSSTNCLEVMSKRTQEGAGEERLTSKSKPMMNLVSRYSARDPNVLASTAPKKPGENQIWKSNTSELVDRAATKNGETCDGR